MSYIGNQPVLQATNFREEFLPTTNQTVFISGGFHPQAISVYRNGVLLTKNGDYTLGTDNVTVTLTNAAVNGDVVVLEGQRQLTQGIQVTEQMHEEVLSSAVSSVTVNFPLDIPAYVSVFLNGVKLWYGNGSGDGTNSDFSINASTRVVSFPSALSIGDLVVVETREPSASDPIDRVTHYNSISENMTVPSSQNVAFFGDTTFSGTITNNGYFTVAHGVANFTGSFNSTGTLHIA